MDGEMNEGLDIDKKKEMMLLQHLMIPLYNAGSIIYRS